MSLLYNASKLFSLVKNPLKTFIERKNHIGNLKKKYYPKISKAMIDSIINDHHKNMKKKNQLNIY